MLNKLFAFILIIVFVLATTVFACMCVGGGLFLDAINKDDLIAHVRIQNYLDVDNNTRVCESDDFEKIEGGCVIPTLMNVKILEIFNGRTAGETVRVSGGDGMNCLDYLVKFPVGTEWIFNLRGGTKYAISACGGEHWLQVKNDRVTGEHLLYSKENKKQDIIKTDISLKEFKERLKQRISYLKK